MIKLLNWINAAICLGIGVYCTLWTEAAAASLGIGLPTPTALTDFRATYGGMCLGVGVFFVLAARAEAYGRAGVWLGGTMCAGLALTRAWGVVTTDSSMPMMVGFLIVEVIVAALNFRAAARP